jgi:hypothetical protein
MSRMPMQLCPRCGYTLDAATHSEGLERKPKPGDITMCAQCQLPLQFGEGLKLESLDLDELEKEHPLEAAQMRKLIATVSGFKKKMQKKGEWLDPKGGQGH